MKILIIGGNRFIGLQLAWNLSGNGHEVFVFNRGNHKRTLPENVTKICGDRKDPAKLKKAFSLAEYDVVLDMCAYTINDLKALLGALPASLPHFVFCSSLAVYDFPQGTYRKNGKGNAQQAYGYNKLLCERYLQDKLNSSLSIVRPTYVYGPNDPSGRITQIFERIGHAQGISIHPSLRKYNTQLIYVEDLCNAILCITENTRAVTEEYNLAYPEAVNFKELIKMASGILQKKIKLNFSGQPSGFPFQLDSDQLIDVRKTWESLDCQPKFNLQKGLERTYAWWKSNT